MCSTNTNKKPSIWALIKAFDALKTKFKTAAITTYHTFRDEFLKPMFRTLQVELIYQFEQMKANGSFERLGGMIYDAVSTAIKTAIKAALLSAAAAAGPAEGAMKFAIEKMFEDDAETADRGRPRTRAEIRKDLSAMTPEQHKRALEARQAVISARIDDKVASLQFPKYQRYANN